MHRLNFRKRLVSLVLLCETAGATANEKGQWDPVCPSRSKTSKVNEGPADEVTNIFVEQDTLLARQDKQATAMGRTAAIPCYVARIASLFGLMVLMAVSIQAQQFNSDSYLSKPAGTVTTILTAGQRNEMLMLTFSLLPRWEFTTSVYIYNADSDPSTAEGYSSSLYGKYMFYENKAKTGGFAVKAGTGLEPGYLEPDNSLHDAFRTYWANAPATVPFFNNKLSWDLMPGFSATRKLNTNANSGTTWAFTYATRLAWYPISPKWSAVGEVLGAEGQGTSKPEYRVGPRWEPNQHIVIAITYDQEFRGTNGAKWEGGVMLFSPQFLCIKCK